MKNDVIFPLAGYIALHISTKSQWWEFVVTLYLRTIRGIELDTHRHKTGR